MKYKGSPLLLICIVIIASLTQVRGQACNYKQVMESGKNYYIFNKEYPKNYPNNTFCQWEGYAGINAEVVFQCSDINIYSTLNCVSDGLELSVERFGVMQEMDRVCGRSPVFKVYNTAAIRIKLYSTREGKFSCVLSARYFGTPQTPPPPTRPPPCKCGIRHEKRIVGGNETQPNEYPWMAAIIRPWEDIEDREWCGATIISQTYALSAAHCGVMHNASEYQLLVGAHNTTSEYDTGNTRIYNIREFIVHENFSGVDDLINDIMLIKIWGKMEFNQYVSPVCLPVRYFWDDFRSEKLKILGFGTEEFTGVKTDVLHQVDVNCMSNTECYNRHDKRKNISDSQICTFDFGKDACQYDSGGPVLWYYNIRYYLVGIVSSGFGCASRYPGINTRVTTFLRWIYQKTGDTDFCIP